MMPGTPYNRLPLNRNTLFLYAAWMCLLVFTGLPAAAQTQALATRQAASGANQNFSINREEVFSAFVTENQELNKRERFVSNALVIFNNKSEKIKFTLELVVPKSWKTIGNPEKWYEVEPHDSIAIPVRVIPGIGTDEGSSVNVQALVVSEDQMLLSDAVFNVHRKKNIRWTISSEDGHKIYFPVNDSVVPFKINVNNEGNEKIDLLIFKNQLGNKIYIEDEESQSNKGHYHEVLLNPAEDTTLRFSASLQGALENTRRIDIENYSPAVTNEEIRNTVFFQSQLSNNLEGNLYSGHKRLDFVRLSDNKTVNPYGSDIIPLIVDANFYNILGIQPIMRMDLRGTTVLSNEALLSYQTLLNFTSYRYNNELTKDLFYRVAYAHKKGEIQVGNISGGLSMIPISGRGVSGSYFLSRSLRVGAYYVNNSFSSQAGNSAAYGGFLRYQLRNIGNTSLQFGQSTFNNNSRKVTYASMSNSIRFLPNQQINFGISVSKNDYSITGETKTGYSYFGGYSGSYFKKKINTSLRTTIFDAEFSTSRLPSSNYFHRTGININKGFHVILQNTFNVYQQYTLFNLSGDIIKNRVNYNQVFFSFNAKGSRFTPSIFYNRTTLNQLNLVYRGLGFDFSKSSSNGQTRFGTSMSGGYNTLTDYREIPSYFTMQFSVAAQHKTLSVNGRYFYGPQYVNSPKALESTIKYPQSLFISLGKQWQPENKSVVFQTNGSYTYMNQFNRHTLGLFPEVYYFTRNKWRFKLSAGYSYNSSRIDREIQGNSYNFTPENEVKKVVTHNFFLNAGVRKEFGIPVPKKLSKRHFANVTFQSFLDVNGNRIKDKNELYIKNVVIRVGNDEVITNENGTAQFNNLGGGQYPFKAMSLVDLQGWYPLIDDSIRIDISATIAVPFVKGIKLNGNIVLQKARYTNVSANADLSRILVTATDSGGKVYQSITDQNGMYTLYLPPGQYTLNMDESIIGKGFVVLKNNAEVKLAEVESYNYNFYILEKKRKVTIKKFGGDAVAGDGDTEK